MTESPTANDLSEFDAVFIEPDSPEVKAQSLLKSRKIDKRYFTIGHRSTRPTALSASDMPDHLVAEKYPYTISREHCEIERLPSGILIRDLHSRMGAVDNGTRIAGKTGLESEITLGLGEHSLVLGRRDGGIRFRIIVCESSPQST